MGMRCLGTAVCALKVRQIARSASCLIVPERTSYSNLKI